MCKKQKFVLDPIINRYNSQLSFGKKWIVIIPIPGQWMEPLQIMVTIDASVIQCSYWNICNICHALSARAVGRAWTGSSRTDRPQQPLLRVIDNKNVSSVYKNIVFFWILTIAPMLIVENGALPFILLV